jgi:hypothetical protein
MKKILFFLFFCTLMFFSTFSDVLAQKKIETEVHGWGLAIGTIFLPNPNFKYEATSIGDIQFRCSAYESSLSALYFGRKSILGWKPLWQGEIGFNWFSESGHKNLVLQGYPATAKSNLDKIGIKAALIANFLKVKGIWVGSGFESCSLGFLRDDFSISVQRQERDIEIFNQGKKRDEYGGIGLILISAKKLDKIWNSWELQFGYWIATLDNFNSYGGHSKDDPQAQTKIYGWYFRIKKLFLLSSR